MRGYLYELSKDIENLHVLTESSYYDKCEIIADYFEDNQDEMPIEFLLDLLKKKGIETGTEIDSNGDEQPWFLVTDETRQSYFKQAFEEAKTLLNHMSLAEFSKNIYQLKTLIEDDYDNGVDFDGHFYNFDQFIRDALPNVRYYIGNVIDMH